MRRIVMDEMYLASTNPVYRGFIGKQIAIFMLKLFGIDKINALCGRHENVCGIDFTKDVLEDIGVTYNIINGQVLNNMPKNGFITVSNHPFGSVDGVILIDIFARFREDYKVMVNGILNRVKSLESNFIGVEPTKGNDKNNANHNLSGIRDCIRHLQNNHPLGFFPAGAISMMDYKTGTIEDRAWQKGALHLIKQAKVEIIPVFFEGINSWFFYQLGRISWKIREIRIAHELFNKKGQSINVYLGDPISVDIQNEFNDLDNFGLFLKNKTYDLYRNLKK